MPNAEYFFWTQVSSFLDHAQAQLYSVIEPMILYPLDLAFLPLIIAVAVGLAVAWKNGPSESRRVPQEHIIVKVGRTDAPSGPAARYAVPR